MPQRVAPAFFVGLVVLLATAGGVTAQPSTSLPQQQARAQAVLAQVQELDSRLSHAIEAYNAANLKLSRLEHELERNQRHLVLAKQNLGTAEKRLADRIVAMYTAGESNSTVAVLLGAQSLNDLLDRIETTNRVSEQDAATLSQVIDYRAEVKRRSDELAKARAAQAQIVRTKASQRASIEGQLRERERLLAGIRSEIQRIQAEERRRSLAIAQRVRAQPPTNRGSATIGVAAATPDGSVVPPPGKYAGVVAIAMRYLGVPYKWGGEHPSTGFDCSGFTKFVFAQIGVSLPHYTGSQWQMGVPVARDQLEPGDLVFFNNLGHMGIYIGNNQFIHAPRTGDVVKISPMSGWYDQRYMGARRL